LIKLNLKDLLKRAKMVDAQEVRLVPGRRTIVVTPAGENEVRGDAQTPERINALLEPVLSPEARRSLSTGWAEWEFDLPGHGPVRATAELKMGLVHASFDLTNATEEVPEVEADLAAPYSQGPGPAVPAAPRVPAHPTIESLGVVRPEEAPVIRDVPDGRTMNPTQPSMRKLETVRPAPTRSRWDTGVAGASTAEIDRLLRKMVEMKASDLHICTGAPALLRLDGDMVPMPDEKPMSAEDVQNTIWPMVPNRNRKEFDETHDTDFAHEIRGLARFRANIFVDINGMGAVFRVIPTRILSVEQLGLPVELLTLCNLSKGLVVVTGPTGSGKSTTLASLIDYINQNQKKHIITIEDPVEFVHPNKMSLLNQREVGQHTQSFKRALRAALREDPDIVLLGEMRDLETIAIAMETAETGHLVFGTLHTSSAPSTIDRIIDQFPTDQQNQIRTMLSTSLKGVIAQVLCKRKGGGRVAALEVMMGVPAIANLIRENKIFQIPSIMQTSRNIGMRMMNDSLFEHVKANRVEPEEALSKSIEKVGLQTMFKQAGIKFNPLA
jgi:twitching motility protein PilT